MFFFNCQVLQQVCTREQLRCQGSSEWRELQIRNSGRKFRVET